MSAGDRDRRHEADLHERGDEHDHCGLDGVGDVHERSFGTSTITSCSDEKSTSGVHWMLLNVSMSR